MPALLNTTCTSPKTRNASSANRCTSSSYAHIADDTVRIDATGAQIRDGVVKCGLVDVAEHHPGAEARELSCCSEADPVGAARDDRCSSVEFLHAATLRLVWARFTQLAADRAPRVGILARLLPVGSAAREYRANERNEERQYVSSPSRVRAHLREHVVPRMVLELQGF